MKKKYIVIGVKDTPNEDRKIIGLEDISDQASLENIIQENIEPIIHFKYYKYEFKGKMLGILEIGDNIDRPYMMKKDNYILKKGDSWIRKGNRQSRVVREDIDKMIRNKFNFVDTKKIKIGIENNFKKEQYIKIPKIDYEEQPSNIENKRLMQLLEKLKEYNEKFEKEKLFQSISGMEGYIHSSKKILNGRNNSNEEEILREMKNVSTDFYDEDYYFILEENGLKLNFSIYNDNNHFLEEVKIEFKIDKNAFLVAEELPEKPQYNRFGIKTSLHVDGYPSVEEKNNYYVITECFKSIRHKELTKIFSEDLRCYKFRAYNKKQLNIKYKISAKNIEIPIEDELILKWN